MNRFYFFKIARKDGWPLFSVRQLSISHGKCRTESGWLHVVAIPFLVILLGVRP